MRIVLVGAGGHASDVLGVIEAINDAGGLDGEAIDVVGLLADGEVDMVRFAGRGVRPIGRLEALPTVDATHYVIGVGYPRSRKGVFDQLVAGGPVPAPALVHPAATVSAGVRIGEGSVVMAGVHLSPMASVGRHACLSNHAVLGHDAMVGDFAGIMPAGVISGNTTLGDGALVGANATLLEGLTMGDWSTLGAAGLAVRDVEAGTTVVGVPARPVSVD